MNNKVMTRMGIAASALLFAGAILWAVTSQASAVNKPVGTTIAPGTVISNAALATGSPIPGFPTTIRVGNICSPLASMGHTLASFPSARFLTSGSKTTVVGQPVTTTDGRRGFTTSVAAFSSKASTGDKAGIGNLEISFDSRNPGVTSTVIANQTTAPFPAQLNSYFHALFTLDGKTYASNNPVHLQATITSFPPARGTEFFLVEDVKATNVSSSSDTITIVKGQVATIVG